ncbi:hypothetical protein, partial [Acinetobacter baumannii]|uniref:hypothetical protein n=1 Tax=Acinetobacter baumannii TaxID=470 RepID=UPI0013D3F3AB
PSWSLLGAPGWLTIQPTTGEIYGTAPATGAAIGVVASASSNGATATSTPFSVHIVASDLTLAGAATVNGMVGEAIANTLTPLNG